MANFSGLMVPGATGTYNVVAYGATGYYCADITNKYKTKVSYPKVTLGTIVIPVIDTAGPSLTITSHTNNQDVNTASISLSGTASDSGKGDNGIQKVTVNGVEANNGRPPGTGRPTGARSFP